MSAVRVAWFAPYFQPAWGWGGPVRSSWALTTALARRGTQITVVATNATPTAPLQLPKVRVDESVRILTADVAGSSLWPGAARFGVAPGVLPALLECLSDADILHVEGLWGAFHPFVPALATWRRVPYVVSPRGTLEPSSFAQRPTRKRIFLATAGRAFVRRAAAFHVTTTREGEGSAPLMAGRPWFVVPNPVPLTHSGSRSAFRARRDLPADLMCIGMFGRLHPQKGHDVLLPALAGFRARRDWRLFLVGPDEEGHGKAILGQAAEAGIGDRVEWLGMLRDEELADAYAGMDLSVLPSRGESFGNVVVEAVGRGCPVIVSDRVGLADWVARTGCGRVVPNSSAAWCDALARFLAGDPVARIAPESMRAAAKLEFSPDAVAAKMLSEYERILGSAAGSRQPSTTPQP